MPPTETDVIVVSSHELRFNAASMPSGTPMPKTSSSAVTPRMKLFLILSTASELISALFVSEWPRSPVAMSPR